MKDNPLRKLMYNGSWGEDKKKTLEDIHWFFRNVAQVGRLTDKLDKWFGADYEPRDKVVIDLMISMSIFTKGLATYSYLKGDPQGAKYMLALSGVDDFMILYNPFIMGLRQNQYRKERPLYTPSNV